MSNTTIYPSRDVGNGDINEALQNAELAADRAEDARDDAQTAESGASGHAAAALGYRNEAEGFRDEAAQSAADAANVLSGALVAANNLSDVADPTTARANIGLNDAGVVNAVKIGLPEDEEAQTAIADAIFADIIGNADFDAAALLAVQPSLDDKLDYEPSSIHVNLSGQTDKTRGSRGPLFIWNDPAPADLIAGYNAGAQIWIGDNPTATPGVGDAVGLTVAVKNGNDRAKLYGVNLLVGLSNSGAGYTDGFLTGLEINVFADYALSVTDPWAGGNRKNGLEIVSQGSTGRLTTAAMVWSADSTGSAWFHNGIALSRIADTGILFKKNPNSPTVDGTNPFQTAAIYDNSDSGSVLKVDGSHTNVINLADITSPGYFVRGKSGAATELTFGNAANYNLSLIIDSGNSSAQASDLSFADRGSVKWIFGKDNTNALRLFNGVSGVVSLNVTAADIVQVARNLDIGGGADALGLGRSMTVNAASGAVGFSLLTAGTTRLFVTTDGSSYAQMLTSGAIPLLLGMNGAEVIRLNSSGLSFASLPVDAADDAAAAAAGVPVRNVYRTGSILKLRAA